jgi:hypothetical protein
VTTPRPTDPLDDDALGALVRDAAAGWTIPAVRLDAPGWRARVRSPRVRRLAGLRATLGRLGQAAGAAVALTVGAALLGVWLSGPRDSGKPSASPGRPSSRPSAVASTPLPKLFVQGPTPLPSRLVMQVESSFAVVDLTTGTLSDPIALGSYGSALGRGVGGSPFCICLTSAASGGGTQITASYQAFDATGAPTSASVPVGVYLGMPDPRNATLTEQPEHAVVRVTHTDPRYAYVGWTLRDHPVWRSGIAVVDTTNGLVVTRVDLPTRGDGEADTRVAVGAPRVVGLTGDGRLIIERSWYSWSPAASQSPTYHLGTDAFTASASHGSLANVAPLEAGQACGSDVTLAGPRPDDAGYWLACVSPVANQTIVRLVGTDGSVDDVRLPVAIDAGGDAGSTSAVSPDGRWLYGWNPSTLTLARIDLGSGAVATGSATAAAPDGPLAALGRWLTPPAAAKVLLSAGIAISPDGSRVYALGIDPGASSSEAFAGSAGILVFDATSLQNVGRWTPTADFVSLAVSADGRWVYAAGSPQFAADGRRTNQPASVTVFDAGTGDVRLIAGSLGRAFLAFPATTVP